MNEQGLPRRRGAAAGGKKDEEELAALTQAAASAWMMGNAEPYLEMTTDGDDYTIFGPFGGEATVGSDTYRALASRVAGSFADGTAELHVVQRYIASDLAVLVLEERQRGTIGGQRNQAWNLRVTQVYRREDDKWKVVHRHADPLLRRRSIEEACALADERRLPLD